MLYQKGKYSAAIDAYTEAITLCPRWIHPIINRALCHRKRKTWASVREDCEKALDIDRESIKANYMLGLSLIFEKQYTALLATTNRLKTPASATRGRSIDPCAMAAGRLSKALEYARKSEATMQDEIWRELARAKYLEWELEATERSARYAAIEAKLRAVTRLASDVNGEADACGSKRNRMDVDLTEDSVMDLTGDDDSVDGAPRSDTQRGVGTEGGAGGLCKEDWAVLEEMLEAVRQRDNRKEDPPDSFCCKLTFEVFRDPVCAPSGHSYERLAILEHLRKVGRFDPITRDPLSERDLRPNISLRNAAHDWLNHHAWAYADIVKPDAPLE